MSSDIACVPPWKVALMERKRRQDKDIGSSGSRQEQLDVNGLPSWKRDILVKKQQAKNTFVFMAKSTVRDVDSDKAEISVEQLDTAMSCANGQSGLPEFNKQHSSTPSSASANSEVINTRNSVQNSTGCTDNDEQDDRPIEERLLPIHRNPILRLDIEKRYNSTSQTVQTVRNSLSPHGGYEHTGSHDQTPTIEEANLVSSPRVFSRSDSECDVFTTDETSSDSEVTYGRGFVHKLLMKFSHLAATDQSVAVHVPPLKQPLSSSSQSRSSTGSGSPGYSLGKMSLTDSEGLLKQTNLVTSRAKCHSVDDLIRDSEHRLSLTDFLENVDIRSSGHIISHNGNGDFESTAKPSIPVRRSSVEDTEELPISNIVSSTRSLFENLVTSPRLPNAAVPHSNSLNRFSHIDTSDKTKSKSGEPNLPVTATPDRDPLLVPNARNGQETKVYNHSTVKHNNVETVKFVANAKENGNGVHLDVVDAMQLSAVWRSQLSDNSPISDSIEDVDTTRTEGNVQTHSIKIHTTNGYRINGQSHKHETDNSQDLLPKLSHPYSSSGLKASDKSEVAKSNHVVVNGKALNSFGNNHDRLESVPTKNEVVSSSTSVTPTRSTQNSTQNEMRKSHADSTSTSQKDSTVRNSHDAWHSTNGENNSWGAGSTANIAQKTGPSRPGKLLIRPASNLVAAKTKTEYLSLTKYNDVRKGEFAPAAKKLIDQAIDDESVVDGDMVHAAAGVDINERTIVFAGAGISLNRSLLNKSRQGKRLQLTFDDTISRTFEYPSEQSLMDASPAQPGDCDYEPDSAVNSSTSGNLRTSPISGTSAAALSSYRSRMQVDYQFGMHFREEPKVESQPAVAKQATDAVKSPDQDSSMWSKGASADLLF